MDAEPRGQKRAADTRSPGVDTQPLQSAPEQRVDVQNVTVPNHWRALPVHHPLIAWHADDEVVKYYFANISEIGSGSYGRVYSVELGDSDTVSAFAGLDFGRYYALKVERIIPMSFRNDPVIHKSYVLELEIALAIRQFGIDTTHFAPLYAWTRWSFDDASVITREKGIYQLMLTRRVFGNTLQDEKWFANPGQMLENYMPGATPYQRTLYTGAAIACQLICAFHMLRSCGLSHFSHLDLHSRNVLAEAAPRGVELLIYTFDAQGTQGLVVPLTLTQNTILIIIDFGHTYASYTHLSAEPTSTTEHEIKSNRDYDISPPDMTSIAEIAFNEPFTNGSPELLTSKERDESIAEFEAAARASQYPPPQSSSSATGPTAIYPELDNQYYGKLLRTLRVFAPFRFGTTAELSARLTDLSELMYGTGSKRLVATHSTNKYRVVHLPDYGAARPVLPAKIAVARRQ